MRQIITLLFLVFIGRTISYSQIAIGIEPFYRNSSSSYVNNTYGLGLGIDFELEKGMFGQIGFSMTVPLTFPGTATLSALDSSTVPFYSNVPIEQKVTDYILHFGFSGVINPKKKDNYFMAFFGLRGILRKININYLGSYDKGLYNSKYPKRNPNIPAAVNIGWNIGFGYWCQLEKIAFFPNISLGFGSGDVRNNHPWNDFPTYLELGCRICIYSPLTHKASL